MKLNKAQIVFLIIAAIIGVYFLTGIFNFILNDAIKLIPKNWSYDFTIKAFIHGYPKILESFILSIVVSFIIVMIIMFLPQKESLFGKASFANTADINKMKLYAKPSKNINLDEYGIIVGKHNNKLLKFQGQQFVALGAPTRSGKGVGIVIPNLLEWGGSCVVQDIKQECFDFTSKYRKEVLGQEVFLFNPFDIRTHRYNPLYYIDMNSGNADGDLQDLAGIIYPLSSKDVFFDQQAQNLFIGLCWLCYDILSTEIGKEFLEKFNLKLDFTLYYILELRQGFKLKISDSVTLESLEDTYKYLESAGVVSLKTKTRLAKYFSLTGNTITSVDGSFDNPLMMFQNDNMRLATSGNDLDFRDLRKKKMTIYIGITPDQLANAKQILNIFWQQLILVNTKELPQANASLKYPVLLLMDEFTASGFLSIYLKGISFIAGYNLRSLMIYQSNSQLETPPPDGYGKEGAKTLLTNHACQIFYAMKDDDADRLSKSLRTKTVKNRSRNIGKGGGGSESETSRALMLPQEIEEMPFEDEIIKIEGKKPIRCKKAIYFNDSYFMDKFKMISPSLNKIKGIPSRANVESAIQNNETRVNIPIQKDKIETYEKPSFKNNDDNTSNTNIVNNIDSEENINTNSLSMTSFTNAIFASKPIEEIIKETEEEFENRLSEDEIMQDFKTIEIMCNIVRFNEKLREEEEEEELMRSIREENEKLGLLVIENPYEGMPERALEEFKKINNGND